MIQARAAASRYEARSIRVSDSGSQYRWRPGFPQLLERLKAPTLSRQSRGNINALHLASSRFLR
jgi:hypothetical protein